MSRCVSGRIATTILIISTVIGPGKALSQNLTETATQAIQFSPDIQSEWYGFAGLEEDFNTARGGYRPTLDFHANYGREIRSGSGWSNGTKSPFNGGRAELRFVQMLYDGFQTNGTVESARGTQLASYFHLMQQVQSTVLDASAAHLDVIRARRLTDLARENLTEHRRVYRQIEHSTGAGVSNNADLDQITGRLSLAQSNLITSRTNQHEIENRFLRVVGTLPPEGLTIPVASDLPKTSDDAFKKALRHNPEFQSSLYRIQASEADAKSKRSGFHPTINLTARYGSQDYDDRGLDNSRTDGRIALELHYNLYNGGRDKAAIRKAYTEVNRSKAQRDSACTVVRQTVQTAYQDVLKFEEQLPILRQHQQSSDRVRRAYRDQFLIGRRSLLDVLDAENEHFQASRALVNAEFDLLLAWARTEAAMGSLLQQVGVVRSDLPNLEDFNAEAIVVDPETACPAGAVAFRQSTY